MLWISTLPLENRCSAFFCKLKFRLPLCSGSRLSLLRSTAPECAVARETERFQDYNNQLASENSPQFYRKRVHGQELPPLTDSKPDRSRSSHSRNQYLRRNGCWLSGRRRS